MNYVVPTLSGSEFERGQVHALSAALDMTTPLSIISEAAVALQSECPSGQREAWVNCILRNTHLLKSVVEDLYEGVPLDVGQMKYQELDLGALVQEAVADYATIAPGYSIQFYGDAAWILGDVELIKRLVFILISNAVKHSKTGREIKVDVWRRGANVCLFVQDDGATLPPANSERMFLPFTRLDEKKNLGSGDEIRLASAKRIADAHGATLRLQGIPGHGTIFEVCFKARCHCDSSEQAMALQAMEGNE